MSGDVVHVGRPDPVSMKLDDAELVVLYLASAYMAELTTLTINTWTDQLVKLDHDAAMEAAQQMVGDTERRFMPVFSEFKIEYDAVVRRRAEAKRDATLALPEESAHTTPTTREQARAYIDEMRGTIAASRARDRLILGRATPNTAPAVARKDHDPARCKACQVNDDQRSGRTHVHTPNADDVAPVLDDDPSVPEPPSDVEG